jgi:hypothetical protein
VRAALIARGLDPRRIVVRGYGPDYPIASNGTIEGVSAARHDDDAAIGDDHFRAPHDHLPRRAHIRAGAAVRFTASERSYADGAPLPIARAINGPQHRLCHP